jgi:hypothetical protein
VASAGRRATSFDRSVAQDRFVCQWCYSLHEAIIVPSEQSKSGLLMFLLCPICDDLPEKHTRAGGR